MAQERLYIDNVWIPLTKSLNPSITKAITDITELQSRKATYSKTVSIPRSKEADKAFSHLFMFNAIDNTFDPSVRAPVRYECDSEVILQGYIRLNKIGHDNNHEITYDCTMFSTAADFIQEISNGYLTDLYESTASFEGLDIYDHSLTKEIQQLSWETEIIINTVLEPFAFGQGYVYALVDYGFSQDSTKFIYTQIGPSIYSKEYLLRMISWAGYTLQAGGWVDTDDVINHLIIPASPECYQLTDSDIEDREFAANEPEFTSTGTTTSGNLPIGSYSANDIVIFTNDSVAPAFDPGLNYNPATGEFTVVSTGVYDLNTILEINATFTPTTGSAVKTICDIHGFIMVFHTPLSTGVPVQIDAMPFYITSDDAAFVSGARSTDTTPTYPDSDYMISKAWGKDPQSLILPRNVNPPDRYQLVVNGAPLQQGDIITIQIKAGIFCESSNTFPFPYVSSNNMFIDVSNVKYTGNATLTISVGSFYNKVANNTMTEGNALQMLDVIPKNIKMIDMFQSWVRKYNLVVYANELNPKELIIKTKDDFYGSTVLNIHEKIDRTKGKPIESTFTAALNARKYLYQFKPDTDFYNAAYLQEIQKPYGDRQVDVLTEFATQDKVTSVIDSPTCMVALAGNDRVLPTICNFDENGLPVRTKHNIRELYYAGLKPCLNAWGHTNYVSVFGIEVTDWYVEYPFAGHWDDPFNPTLDINWGLVEKVFYDDNINSIVITNNNLVNKYHSKDLRQYTDPESRIVKAWVHMRAADFTNFTFDKLYYWDFAYFRLQEIEGYNPASQETTLCTFLKLVDAPDFTADTHTLTGKPGPLGPNLGGGGNVDMTETTPAKGQRSYDQPNNNSYLSKSVVVQGEFNHVNATAKNIEIYGDSNKVFAEANNIKIHGSGNTIEAGVENVVLINTNDLTITESDVTYINGLKSDAADNGTYTPTDSANANLDSCSLSPAIFFKRGNIVTVFGYFDADPTATLTATSFEIDLPIPSDISALEEVSGTANSGTAPLDTVQIIGSIANDTAVFTWTSRVIVNSRWSYHFHYKIN